MNVVINKDAADPIKYRIVFQHNKADKVAGVVIYKNERFLSSGTAICDINDEYCKDCCRKNSLASAIENAKLAIPREHRYKIWNVYRKLPSKEPRWTKSKLNSRKAGGAVVS